MKTEADTEVYLLSLLMLLSSFYFLSAFIFW